MSAWTIARTVALGVLVCAGWLVGCGMEQQPTAAGSGGYAGSSSGSGSTSSGGNAGQPMLVDIDADRTMSANPGDGVGVFTEYQAGGHWNVWWTCDTNKTTLPCDFDVTVTVSTGSIANLAGQALGPSDTLTQGSPQQIQAVTTTTTTVEGITFDTVVPAGKTPVITLDAKLGGVEDPAYLFFVQSGQINGDYAGTLTDPLMLEPSSP